MGQMRQADRPARNRDPGKCRSFSQNHPHSSISDKRGPTKIGRGFAGAIVEKSIVSQFMA